MTRAEAVEALSKVVTAVLETVKEHPVTGAPLGPMYLAFVAHGLSYGTFEEIIKGMEDAGKIRVTNDVAYPM